MPTTAETGGKRQPDAPGQSNTLWKRLFSLSSIALVLTLVGTIFQYIQLTQARSSEAASGEVLRIVSAQYALDMSIATDQARGANSGPTATAIAGEIARAVATRDALELVKRQAEATATAAARPRFVGRINVEVFLDANHNSGIDRGLDPLYAQSNYRIPLQVNRQNTDGSDYGPPETITVWDSDDGVIDGKARLDLYGDYYAAHVSYGDSTLDLAAGYRDVSSTCPGPPSAPNGCVEGALIYDRTSGTLRLLVQQLE